MIRNWLRNFMIGRYGPDQLGMALLVASIVLGLAGNLFRFNILGLIAYIPLLIAVFRLLSRNIPRRRAENDRFLKYWWPLKKKIAGKFQELRDRKYYRYYKCPSCGSKLRLPKGKGKIQITCPKCGERFIKKT